MVLQDPSTNRELKREVTFRAEPGGDELRAETRKLVRTAPFQRSPCDVLIHWQKLAKLIAGPTRRKFAKPHNISSWVLPESSSRRAMSKSSSRWAKATGSIETELLRSGQPTDLAHIQRLHVQLLGRVQALADIGKLQPDEIRENEYLRSFRLRLCKVEEEVARRGEGPKLDWRQEALNMSDELERTHSLVCQLEHQIKIFQERLQNAQSEAEEREEEHQTALQQVAAYDEENVTLKKAVPAAPKLVKSPTQSWREMSTTRTETPNPGPPSRPQTAELSVSDRRQLEDAIRRYKKLLEAESQKTREARAAHLAVEFEFQKYREAVLQDRGD